MTVKRDCRCPRARHVHGTWHAYTNDDCRCQPCRRAWAAYTRHLRHRRHCAGGTVYVDPVGTARRLQALAANGWGLSDIAPLIGMTSTAAIGLWRAGRYEQLRPLTVTRIKAVYDQVWDKPSPNRYAVKIRRNAAANGWLPPLAWDDDEIDKKAVEPILTKPPTRKPDSVDEIAVAEAVRGRRVSLTKQERAEAVRRMTDRGYSAAEIAERLGTSDRLVTRYRSKEAA